MTSTIHDIRGAQNPLDRLGRPLHDLRISVMDRCNFRCPYCMPKERFHENYQFLKSRERLSFDEITRLTKLFTGLGVRKVRLTGGEPLLRANLADLVGDLTGIPGIDDIALTTNGVLLANHAVDLHANGLKRITVSLDTLDKDVFARLSGGFGALDQVLGGIDAAIAAGLAPVKINAVIERGVNDHTALDDGVTLPGHAGHRALHRIHGCRKSQSLAAGYGGAVARTRGANQYALADAACVAKLSRRSRGALAFR